MSSVAQWSLLLTFFTLIQPSLQSNRDHRCDSSSAPPAWKKTPINDYQVHPAGKLLVLDCAAYGTPKPKVIWYRDGQPAFRTHREKLLIQGEKLVIRDLISRIDDGNYTCVVENCRGKLSHTVIIRVQGEGYLGPPEFNKQPKNQTVTEGQSANLICTVYSARPCETRWIQQKESQNVHHNETGLNIDVQYIKTSVGSIHVNDTTLLIINATLNDTGLYTCQVICEEETLYGRAAITVLPVSHHKREGYIQRFLSNDMWFILSTFCLFGLVILTTAITSVCVLYHRRERKRELRLFHRSLSRENALTCHMDECLSQYVDKHYHIDTSRIKLCELVGEGAFGRVFRGLLDGNATVAIKMLKDSATDKQRENLIHEVVLMASVKSHENVIQFIGSSVTSDGCLQILMEYANHGSLRDFLHANRQDESDNFGKDIDKAIVSQNSQNFRLKPVTFLIGFAYQVASGMQFLSSKNIIHRDLAARNILVAEINDVLTLKIADFGLTRGFSGSKEYYRLQLPCRLPIKWMSPESMSDNKFTTKSDVWSYGVLLWEIYTFGENPYPSIPLQNLYSLLKSGYRMPQPLYAPDSMYEIMACCWRFDASYRPTFEQLETRISEIIDEEFGVAGGLSAVSNEDKWMHPDANGNVAVNSVSSCGSDLPLIAAYHSHIYAP